MKFLSNIFFLFVIVSTYAQTENTEPVKETPIQKEDYDQIVKGEVRDKNTSKLLTDAEIVLKDEGGNVLEIQKVAAEVATFSFAIKKETTYILEAKREEYTPESKRFTTSKETNKELKMLILLDKGAIDFLATPKKETVKDSSAVSVKEEETNIEKAADPEVKIITDNYPVTINPIYFDLASSYFNRAAKKELREAVKIMKKYPTMVLELAGHSDAQGSDKINNWFAIRRANRVREYMIARGISPHRIISKGYGASELVNHCSREIECTDEEHAKNRRTEFVIIKM